MLPSHTLMEAMTSKDIELRMELVNGLDMGTGMYKCSACHKRFKTPVEVRRHKKECLGEPGKYPSITHRYLRKHPNKQ